MQRVHASSRFWNASGIDMSIGAEGVKIDTQSLVSILIGGIAFDTPEHDETDVAAAAETVFPLYESRTAVGGAALHEVLHLRGCTSINPCADSPWARRSSFAGSPSDR